MTYTALQLITRAYYLSSVVSRGFQSVSGDQAQDGLFLLNDLLAVRSIDIGQIPFFQEYSLTPVIGQEKYFIPGLVSEQSSTFLLNGTVRTPMTRMTREEYFAGARVNGISSLPFSYHVERVKNGSDFYMYFSPDQVYPVKIWGKFALTQITNINTDLSLNFERSYLVYLRYLLASAICEENNIDFPEQARQKLLSYEAMFKDISPYDFSRQSIIPLGCDSTDGFNEALKSQRFGAWRP
jgi:hypothetical protein